MLLFDCTAVNEGWAIFKPRKDIVQTVLFNIQIQSLQTNKQTRFEFVDVNLTAYYFIIKGFIV